jgi:UDPglucose 6-dehydrogenase
MRIAVAGGGYVGLTTATGFARQGHQVDVIEVNQARAKMLAAGCLPFREPSLADAFHDETLAGSITVHSTYPPLFGEVDFAFICTSTPLTSDGRLDTEQVFDAAQMLVDACGTPLRIVIRSTVNPGTTARLQEYFQNHKDLSVLVNPEFLREGSGLHDFESPARVVIGGTDEAAINSLFELYSFATLAGVPILRTDPKTAELIKLASNAALAVRVSMANEIAHVASSISADIEMLMQGIGGDPRIGQAYLTPGIGFGGSCLPKDLAAFRSIAQQTGFCTPVFDGASLTNDTAVGRLASKALEITQHIPRPRICIVGVGFKPGSDSLRNSQAVRLIQSLLVQGASVILFDPRSEPNARQEFQDQVSYADSMDDAVADSDLLIVLDMGLAEGSMQSTPDTIVIDSLGRPISLIRSSEAQIVHGS